jgi:hypothetical protein
MSEGTLVVDCGQEARMGLSKSILRLLSPIFYAVDFYDGTLHLHYRGMVAEAKSEAVRLGLKVTGER